MAPLRASTTKSEWLPDDPTAFVPSMPWKLPFITTWDDSRNQNHPTDSAEEAHFFVVHLRRARVWHRRRTTNRKILHVLQHKRRDAGRLLRLDMLKIDSLYRFPWHGE